MVWSQTLEYAIIVKKRGEQMSVKERILQSAEELIYQKGYDATSISDIMEVADVGKGQLYYYFKSKKEIGLTVIQDILAKWRKELLKIFLKQTSLTVTSFRI